MVKNISFSRKNEQKNNLEDTRHCYAELVKLFFLKQKNLEKYLILRNQNSEA